MNLEGIVEVLKTELSDADMVTARRRRDAGLPLSETGTYEIHVTDDDQMGYLTMLQPTCICSSMVKPSICL